MIGREWLTVEDVETGSGETARTECFDECRLRDDRALVDMFTKIAPRFILARSSARSVLRERSENTMKDPEDVGGIYSELRSW